MAAHGHPRLALARGELPIGERTHENGEDADDEGDDIRQLAEHVRLHSVMETGVRAGLISNFDMGQAFFAFACASR